MRPAWELPAVQNMNSQINRRPCPLLIHRCHSNFTFWSPEPNKSKRIARVSKQLYLGELITSNNGSDRSQRKCTTKYHVYVGSRLHIWATADADTRLWGQTGGFPFLQSQHLPQTWKVENALLPFGGSGGRTQLSGRASAQHTSGHEFQACHRWI